VYASPLLFKHRLAYISFTLSHTTMPKYSPKLVQDAIRKNLKPLAAIDTDVYDAAIYYFQEQNGTPDAYNTTFLPETPQEALSLAFKWNKHTQGDYWVNLVKHLTSPQYFKMPEMPFQFTMLKLRLGDN